MSLFDISWDNKHNKMQSHDKKQGIFPSTLKTYVSMLLQIKEQLEGKTLLFPLLPTNVIIILVMNLLMS